MKPFLSYLFALILPLFLLTPATGVGQDFVYSPKNPAFGGSPINYQWLLNSANTQNKFEESRSRFDDPLADFQESLQRQVFRELTRNVISDRFGDIDLSQENTFEFGEFSIDILPGPNGIDIIILNLSTGEQTTVTIPEF
jgi:curli production assembly/transport component CsgF